jgi:hypothetical protein
MRDVILKVAAIGWIVATALCILSSVKLFGPIAIVLLSVGIATDSERKIDPAVVVIFSIPTALAIFFGIQRHEQRLEQIAYLGHRQAIGCSEADQWEALGDTTADSSQRRPNEHDLQRCGGDDDAWKYKFALEKKGWPSTWLE